MPRFNLKDEAAGAEPITPDTGKAPAAPTLREVGGGSGSVSPLILVLLALVILAAGVFALNYFKVIHLWGKKAPVVVETLPEPDLPNAAAEQSMPPPAENLPLPATTPEAASAANQAAPKASLEPARDLSVVPTGTGKFTIQFSAWNSKAKAEDQASKFVAGGYEAYVAQVQGWYLVRVGRFDSRAQAHEMVAKLQNMTEDDVYVAQQR
jgi:septal ring-binding cell division protein DamX